MKIYIKTLIAAIACICISANAYSEKVIFDCLTFPITDVGYELILQGTGKTTITDVGEGLYVLDIRIGNEQVLSDLIYEPKVVSSKLIQFNLISLPDDFVLSISPETISLADELAFGLYTTTAFDTLLNNLRGQQALLQSPKNNSGSIVSTLPSSGNLTPTVFADHPFGFLPSGMRGFKEAERELKSAGWKADINDYGDSSQIIIISSDGIPFKMCGKNVSVMSCWGDNINNIKTYGLELSDFKTNWSQNDAIVLAQRIVDELVKESYSINSEDNDLYGYQFYRKTLKGKGKEITVDASQASKYESLDSYGVGISIRFQ